MKNKGLSSAIIAVIMIIIAAAAAGGYIIISEEGEKELGNEQDELKLEENPITENVAKLGLQFGETRNYFENIETSQTRYTDNLLERANWSTNSTVEKLQKIGFEEAYSISLKYFETLFTVEWEEELSTGPVPVNLRNKFQQKDITLPENTFIGKGGDYWTIGMSTGEKWQGLYRARTKKTQLRIQKYKPSIYIYSDLNKYSTIEGVDNSYESFYEKMKNSWENMDYDPEEKALEKYKDCLPENQTEKASENENQTKKVSENENQEEKILENGEINLFDNSFVRYYENIGYGGTPGFGISFRERNIAGTVFVSGDVPCLSKKTIKLSANLEKRLEKSGEK